MRPGCNMFKQADSLAPELTALLKQDGAQSIACHITMQGNNDKEIHVDSRFSIYMVEYQWIQ
jgi:hypothetical protein